MTSPLSDEKMFRGLPIAIALVLSAVIFGCFYYFAQSANTKDILSVTGSTKTRVLSDQAKLVVSISHIVPTSQLSAGYASVAKDLGLARALLLREGMLETDFVDSHVLMNQQYEGNQTAGAEMRYELRQTLTIQSGDVAKLTAVSKKIPSLASQGAIVAIQSLEYYYSGLADLRVTLLGDAVKDAHARARKIAEGTGRTIGSVQSAANGVVQVMPVNSVEVSDYGSYDTTSIEKEVMITLKASFYLN